ncbi:MAG: hypothetical protein E4H07_10070 [Nitrosomonadales bacterium]|nr:MAG: hypothetical protein E4H07_10070 [Nitrosomonadales bacterium]
MPALDIQRKIAATAFIHDIGKMSPDTSSLTKRVDDFVYFSVPNHPSIGSDYIRGTKTLPILDKNMNQAGSLNIPNLLGELGFQSDEDIEMLAKIIDLHWEFGNYLQRWRGYDDIETVTAFIKRVGSNEPFSFFFALLIVSVADVLASQPYGMNNLTAELNHHSRFFPFISNVPKKYRGGDIADATAAKRNAFGERILDWVLEKSGIMEVE